MNILSTPARYLRWLAAALALAATLGCQNGAGPAPLNLEETEQISATIGHLDRERRLMSLYGADGSELTVTAGPEIRNFDQLKVGDTVVVNFYAAIAAEMVHRGSKNPQAEPPMQEVYALRADPGERPGGAAGMTETVRIVIDAVDKSSQTISFTDATGMTRAIGVADPAAQKFIAQLKKGDMVDITFSEAVAVSIEPVELQ